MLAGVRRTCCIPSNLVNETASITVYNACSIAVTKKKTLSIYELSNIDSFFLIILMNSNLFCFADFCKKLGFKLTVSCSAYFFIIF